MSSSSRDACVQRLRRCAELDREVRQEGAARSLFDPLLRRLRAELRGESEVALLADYRLAQVGCVGCVWGGWSVVPCTLREQLLLASEWLRQAGWLAQAVCCACADHRTAPFAPPPPHRTPRSGPESRRCCGSRSSTAPSRTSGAVVAAASGAVAMASAAFCVDRCRVVCFRVLPLPPCPPACLIAGMLSTVAGSASSSRAPTLPSSARFVLQQEQDSRGRSRKSVTHFHSHRDNCRLLLLPPPPASTPSADPAGFLRLLRGCQGLLSDPHHQTAAALLRPLALPRRRAGAGRRRRQQGARGAAGPASRCAWRRPLRVCKSFASAAVAAAVLTA